MFFKVLAYKENNWKHWNEQKSISAKKGHLNSRAECIEFFQQFYPDSKPYTTDFRADPVLYKMTLGPIDENKFADVGQL